MFTPEEIARDPFQNEFAHGHDIYVEAGMVVARHAGSNFIINIPRDHRVGSYSDGELQAMNRLPVWSTGESNRASQRVAEKIGLKLVRRRTYLSVPHDA